MKCTSLGLSFAIVTDYPNNETGLVSLIFCSDNENSLIVRMFHLETKHQASVFCNGISNFDPNIKPSCFLRKKGLIIFITLPKRRCYKSL